MMGRISIKTEGMGAVLERLDITGQLDVRAPKALTAGAEIVVRRAKETAPEREGSGVLKRAIRVGKRKRSSGARMIEAGVFYNDTENYAPYAHLVEYGHGGPHPAPPHPFLEPAARDAEDEAADAIMKELMKGL